MIKWFTHRIAYQRSSLSYQLLIAFALFIVTIYSASSYAAVGDLALFSVREQAGSQDYTVNIQILLAMTMLSLLPIMVLMMTCFTRFIIVLAILRQALGLQQSPPNKVLTGIALTLTLLVMRPVWLNIEQQAIDPWQREEITMPQAIERALPIVKKFMLSQTDHKALAQMMHIAAVKGEPLDLDLTVIVPAFLLSELKTAFTIGFMIYIPFLIVDMLVASVLMAMGMMMLSPLIVSLPFKLILFVLCDGWTLIVGTLTSSVQGVSA